MKRLLLLVTIISFVALLSVVTAQEKAKITFEEVVHDYGSFKESAGVQTTSFKFTNTGAVPLVLSNVRTSCGCTTPKWTREPVAPGKDGEIQVSYNPKNRPGTFNKTVTISSNAENASVILRIKGTVAPREKTLAEKYPRKIGSLRVKSNHISFAKLNQNSVETEELELINDTDKPVVVGMRTVPKHMKVTVEPSTIPAKGKGKLIVTYNAKEANTYGFASHRIYLSLNGSKDYKSSIGVSATIEEDFSKLTPEQLASAPVVSFTEKSHDFGEMKQGDKKDFTFTIANSGKSDLIIRRVRTSCGCTAVAPSTKTIAAGESAPIKVTFNSRGKRGRQSKSITVITNDPKTPTTTLRITSNVIVPAAN
ncbi:MAG: DUF1573 domain-containing protein [Draconibacterium sp.]|nr:DUF1573 domain-containing protein [Draconibacterium sp.]